MKIQDLIGKLKKTKDDLENQFWTGKGGDILSAPQRTVTNIKNTINSQSPVGHLRNIANTPTPKVLQQAVKPLKPLADFGEKAGNFLQPLADKTTMRTIAPALESLAIAGMNDRERVAYKPTTIKPTLNEQYKDIASGTANTALTALSAYKPIPVLKNLAGLTLMDAALPGKDGWLPSEIGRDIGLSLQGKGTGFSGSKGVAGGVLGRIPENLPRATMYGLISNPAGDKTAELLKASRVGKSAITGAFNVGEDYVTYALGMTDKPDAKSNIMGFLTPALVDRITGAELSDSMGLGKSPLSKLADEDGFINFTPKGMYPRRTHIDYFNRMIKGILDKDIPEGMRKDLEIPEIRDMVNAQMDWLVKQSGAINFGAKIGGDRIPVKQPDTASLDKIIGDIKESDFQQPIKVKVPDEKVDSAFFSEGESKGFKTKWNDTFNRIKNAPEGVQKILQGTRNHHIYARERANQLAREFADIPEKEGWNLIRYMQNPTEETAKSLNFDPTPYAKDIENIRNVYDSLRNEGISKGLDIDYLDNYINQVWKQSPEEIQKIMSASKNPQFTKQRTIPSYEEGIGMGLTPKYTHPAQLVAHYAYQLEKAIANSDLISDLKRTGAIIDMKDVDLAPRGYKSINIPGMSPTLMAEENTAKALNTMFDKGESGLWEYGAKASRFMQDITLSGGYKQYNAFTYGQLVKELTAGNVVTPVKALIAPQKTLDNLLDSRAGLLKEASKYGYSPRTYNDYQKMFKNLEESKPLKEKLGEAFSTFTGADTFNKFMPALEVDHLGKNYDFAKKNGYSEEEAVKFAVDSMKNFMGIVDNFTRTKGTDDVLSTLFFAPGYRESMINFWVNNAKAMTKELGNPSYRDNRKFMAGVAVTAILYNLLNKKLTGHYMWENKGGKELFLEVPREGGRSWYIPILPSVSTVPRRFAEVGGALIKGDTRTAGQRAGTLLSQPISLGSQLLTNKTFYGSPIYNEEDTTPQRLLKLGGYGLGQSTHPYIGEPLEVLQGRKTPIEGVLGLAEMPVYPSSSSYTKDLKGGQKKVFNELVKADESMAKAYAEGVTLKKGLFKDAQKVKIKGVKDLDKVALAMGAGTYLENTPEGLEGELRQKEVLSDARKIYKDKDLPEETKKALVERMGLDYQEVELAAVSGLSTIERAIWVKDRLKEIPENEKDSFLRMLGEKTLSGSRILTDSVAEKLGLGGRYGSKSKLKIAQTPRIKFKSSQVQLPQIKIQSQSIKPTVSKAPAFTQNPTGSSKLNVRDLYKAFDTRR